MKTYCIYLMLNDGLIKLVKLQAINKHEAVEAVLLDHDLDDIGVNEIQIKCME
jgi:hypothetical protein